MKFATKLPTFDTGTVASLTHVMPRVPDIYTPRVPLVYPFPTLFPANPDDCIPQLVKCFPPKEDLLKYLRIFETRVNICSFPQLPVEITSTLR